MATLADRRRFLRRTAGAALLPLFGMDRTSAQAARRPIKRFVGLTWCNGVVPEKFWPAGGTQPLTTDMLPPILRGIASNPHWQWKGQNHLKDVNILGGLRLAHVGWGAGHLGFNQMLTGTNTPNSNGTWNTVSTMMSLDQVIADGIAAAAPHLRLKQGLILGAQSYGGFRAGNKVSWRGKDQPTNNGPDLDPYRVYERLFGGAGATERLLLAQRSVLDAVREDVKAFRVRLGAEDRQRLDRHLSAIRTLEGELAAGAGKTPAAALDTAQKANADTPVVLTADGKVDVKNNRNFPLVAKAHMDLVALALQADVTRVAIVMLADGTGANLVPSWLGNDIACKSGCTQGGNGDGLDAAAFTWHSISHRSSSLKVRIDAYMVEQFLYLVAKLKSLPDADGTGTLLDNSLLLFMNPQSDGPNHFCWGVPWLQAGRAGGLVRTGRYIKWGNWDVRQAKNQNDDNTSLKPDGTFESHARLLLSVARALDVGVGSFAGETRELPGFIG